MSGNVWTDTWERQSLDLFKSLIRIDTSNPPGNEAEAARYIRRKLEERGIGSICFEPEPGRANVIAKLGSGSKPSIVLLSHLDVVSADSSQWSHPPFEAHEEDGVIYGRGTLDTKQLTAMQLTAFLMLKEHEESLDRTIYFVATADEETGSRLGMEKVVEAFPELQEDGYVISEGGGFPLLLNGRNMILCAAGEKGVCKISIRAEGGSGHASCPPDNQAIFKLSDALGKLAGYKFPKKYTELSRNFILETGLSPDSKKIVESTYNNLLQYMLYDGLMINDVRVGERSNVIPGSATAEIEFRVLPGTTSDDVGQLMKKLMRGIDAEWTIVSFEDGYESSIDNELLTLFEENCLTFGLDTKLVPFLALGRTDGRFMGPYTDRIYGFSPTLLEDHFAAVLQRVHQHDERISRDSYLFGAKVLTKTLMDLCVH
ncbi:M20/M25/M40 family metallo-hydrolase [Cohnella lupini]|uniref:Acetylornithine deacetylase/succinyl-diaminopimelate desuccinylase-like protein n=1 Tax=Cohnella lupini TaxID=1294267 RepID=A0A3D9IVQ7_9BACL|nr:M20/M25/M40 family metallo-hydrolase [Cohnella lupini]RED65933.1 acetylornithine deacetylase/succinyl-diaminopimelate desuccinylase-like protein [Cohnella lupini]